MTDIKRDRNSKPEKRTKTLAAVLRAQIGTLGALALSCAIFAGIFALYGLPMQAVLYPALLCAVLWGGYLCDCAVRSLRQEAILQRLNDLPPEQLTAQLPPAHSREAEGYRVLLCSVLDRMGQQQQAAEQQSRQQREYYTLWAHQIKTPIAAMQLTLQQEDSALARQLRGELIHVTQYVDMALLYLRLEDGGRDLVLREQPLDPILREAVRKFRTEFIQRRLRLDLIPTDLTVLTDEKWLSFVVEQLVSNALKYTPAGEIRIYGEAPDTLCIADTGIGIAPEDLPRIFEKGFTGTIGRREKQASGIGLYLCRRLCDDLGHGIEVQSRLGQGTTVRLRLGHKALRFE